MVLAEVGSLRMWLPSPALQGMAQQAACMRPQRGAAAAGAALVLVAMKRDFFPDQNPGLTQTPDFLEVWHNLQTFWSLVVDPRIASCSVGNQACKTRYWP